MVGVRRVVSGNERQRSLETDGWSQKSCKWQRETEESGDRWLLSVELQMAMRDRRVCRQMVGVRRVVSGNERQRSL